VLNKLLAPVAGVAAMGYRYTRGSQRAARQIALGGVAAGAGVLAIADMLNIFRVGALAPFLWLVVLGGALVGLLRAPLTSIVLVGVVATTGFLYSVRADSRYIDKSIWRYRPEWIGNRFGALAIIGAAFFLIGSRQLAWLDDRWFESRRGPHPALCMLRFRFRATDPTRGRMLARWLAAVAIVGLPIVKWIQLEHFTGQDGVRQLILIAVLCVMVGAIAIAQGKSLGALRGVFLAALVGGPFSFGGGDRWLRLLLGATSVVLATAGYGAAQHWSMIPGWFDRPWQEAALTAAALLPLAALVWWEWKRAQAARIAGDAAPAHLVLWTVGPGVLVWVGLTVFPLARHWHLLQSAAATRKQFFTIALGEEVLFRGLLLAILVAAGWDFFSFALASVGFGLWHVPDAIHHVGSDTRVASILLTFVAMFLVSQLVFVPLRLRSRNVLAPAFVHAAWNVSLTSFWRHHPMAAKSPQTGGSPQIAAELPVVAP